MSSCRKRTGFLPVSCNGGGTAWTNCRWRWLLLHVVKNDGYFPLSVLCMIVKDISCRLANKNSSSSVLATPYAWDTTIWTHLRPLSVDDLMTYDTNTESRVVTLRVVFYYWYDEIAQTNFVLEILSQFHGRHAEEVTYFSRDAPIRAFTFSQTLFRFWRWRLYFGKEWSRRDVLVFLISVVCH